MLDHELDCASAYSRAARQEERGCSTGSASCLDQLLAGSAIAATSASGVGSSGSRGSGYLGHAPSDHVRRLVRAEYERSSYQCQVRCNIALRSAVETSGSSGQSRGASNICERPVYQFLNVFTNASTSQNVEHQNWACDAARAEMAAVPTHLYTYTHTHTHTGGVAAAKRW